MVLFHATYTPPSYPRCSSYLYCFLNDYIWKLTMALAFSAAAEKKNIRRRHQELRDDLETKLQNGHQNRGPQQGRLPQ